MSLITVDLRQIKFGTDGVRGVIDFDFNEQVVAAVVEASLRYFKKRRDVHKVLISYDTRRKAELYAKIAVYIAKRHDVEVTLVTGPTPTPVVSWTVREFKYDLAFQITASHNPPQYCGIKVINWHGASIPDEDANGIMQVLQKETEEVQEVVQTLQLGTPDIMFDPRKPYVEYVTSQIGKIDKKLKVCVDPLYGTTIGYTDAILRELGCEVETIHNVYDPNFGGLTPNPEGENIEELRRLVVEKDFDLGIAHDGDGDRVTIVLRDGSVLGGNELLCLLTEYFAKLGRLRKVARTVATTHIVDKICREYGIEIVETPVGIKYIAELLIKGEVELGGEESGGVAFKWHIPEKDGIYTGCLLAKLHAEYGIENMLREISNKYGTVQYMKKSIKVSGDPRELLSRKLKDVENALEKLGKVLTKSQIDGLKVLYDDYTWILVRPSGTEPVIRVYCESTQDKCTQLISEVAKILQE